MSVWWTVRAVEIIVSALIATEFVIAYHKQTRGQWRRRRPMGVHLMAFSVAAAAVLSLWGVLLVMRWLGYGIPGWFDVVAAIAFAPIPVLLLQRRILLARAQGGPESSVE